MNRDQIAALECLSFVRASSDYWDLVSDCRIGFAPHQRQGNASGSAYDVVYGPVSLWAQQLIIHDADQVSFHTAKAVAALPPPNVYDVAPSSNGLFP